MDSQLICTHRKDDTKDHVGYHLNLPGYPSPFARADPSPLRTGRGRKLIDWRIVTAFCCIVSVSLVLSPPSRATRVGFHIWLSSVNSLFLAAHVTRGPIRNVFATSHVRVNLLLSATSQNLYEWGLRPNL